MYDTIKDLRAAPYEDPQDLKCGAAGLCEGTYVKVDGGTRVTAHVKNLVFQHPDDHLFSNVASEDARGIPSSISWARYKCQ